jgi:hypothetical protein
MENYLCNLGQEAGYPGCQKDTSAERPTTNGKRGFLVSKRARLECGMESAIVQSISQVVQAASRVPAVHDG